MGDWGETTLGELGTLYDGPHATPVRRGEGPYFLNISSLKDGRLDLTESDHVSEQDFERWTRRVVPESGDLLFSYETRLGDAALMPDGVRACLGRRMALLRPDRSRIDPHFLLYYYLSPAFKALIDRNSIHGATVNRIALSTMGDWSVRVPELSEQRAIAGVLSALDDKIEANTRLAATADDLARSEFGRALRENHCELVPLGTVANVVLGGTPNKSREEYWVSGDVAWLASGKANESRVLEPSAWITQEALRFSAAKMMPRRATLIAITGATMGQIARLEIEACGNQSLVGVWSESRALNDWLYCAISNSRERLLERATGAAQQHVNKNDVVALAIPTANTEVIGEWSRRVSPLLDAAAQADRASIALASIRETLLPQLMSGKLRVREAAEMAGL